MLFQHPNQGHAAEKNVLFTGGDASLKLSFVWVLPDNSCMSYRHDSQFMTHHQLSLVRESDLVAQEDSMASPEALFLVLSTPLALVERVPNLPPTQ